jgi:hypothetical protein
MKGLSSRRHCRFMRVRDRCFAMTDGQLPPRRRSAIAAGVALAVVVAPVWVFVAIDQPATPPPLGEPVKARAQPDPRPGPQAEPRTAPRERRRIRERSQPRSAPARPPSAPAQQEGPAAQPVQAPDPPPAGDDEDDDEPEDVARRSRTTASMTGTDAGWAAKMLVAKVEFDRRALTSGSTASSPRRSRSSATSPTATGTRQRVVLLDRRWEGIAPRGGRHPRAAGH